LVKLFTDRQVFNYKCLIPVVLIGIISVAIFAAELLKRNTVLDVILLLVVGKFVFTGWNLYRLMKSDLIDEVYDDGDSLVLVQRGRCESVMLKEIINVNYQSGFNTSMVTLTFRYSTRLGRKISFKHPTEIMPSMGQKSVDELILRIDMARKKSK